MLVFFFAFILWVYLIIRYANKNRIEKEEEQDTDQPSISFRNLLILGLTGAAFGLMIYGILWLEWGFNEMSAEFFVLGIIVGFIGKLGFNETCEVYIKGFKELTFAVIIVGYCDPIPSENCGIIIEMGVKYAGSRRTGGAGNGWNAWYRGFDFPGTAGAGHDSRGDLPGQRRGGCSVS